MGKKKGKKVQPEAGTSSTSAQQPEDKLHPKTQGPSGGGGDAPEYHPQEKQGGSKKQQKKDQVVAGSSSDQPPQQTRQQQQGQGGKKKTKQTSAQHYQQQISQVQQHGPGMHPPGVPYEQPAQSGLPQQYATRPPQMAQRDPPQHLSQPQMGRQQRQPADQRGQQQAETGQPQRPPQQQAAGQRGQQQTSAQHYQHQISQVQQHSPGMHYPGVQYQQPAQSALPQQYATRPPQMAQWGPPQQSQPQMGLLPGRQQSQSADQRGLRQAEIGQPQRSPQQQATSQRGQPAGGPQHPHGVSQTPYRDVTPVSGSTSEGGSTPYSGGSTPQRGGTPRGTPQRGTAPRKESTTQGDVSSLSSRMEDMQLSSYSKEPVKPGIKGRRIPVETNHLRLNLGSLKTAYHYDVNLVPDTPKKFLRHVVEIFRQKHFKNRYPAFDGRKNLYSSRPLPISNDCISDEIVMQDSDGREKNYKVEIKFANEVDLTPLSHLSNVVKTPAEAQQVVDIVLRMAPAVSCISVGRSFFIKPPSILDLGEGMEMYNGFYQSAVRGWKPYLNVDVAHKAFPKKISLIGLIIELLSSRYEQLNEESLRRPLRDNQIQALSKFIKTLRVIYEIPGHPSSRRQYRVNGLGKPASEHTFKLDDNRQMTIVDYFAREKNYRLRYTNLPTVWVGSMQRENKIYLPLELCVLDEGQVTNRKMTENQTRSMIRYSATSTAVRKSKIIDGLKRANHNAHPCVQEFGFSVDNRFEQLTARVLDPPEVVYAGERRVKPSRGVWRGERFFNGSSMDKWTIICVDRRPPKPEEFSKVAKMIYTNAAQCGMNVLNEAQRPFDTIRPTANDIKKYFHTQKGKFDVIFVLIPNSGPVYSLVKTAAEINVGCLTQCIKLQTVFKFNPQTAMNILLKVNSKLNGRNHYVIMSRPSVMDRPCMIMGADVTHPSPDARDIPSVAAVTASHDPKAFQYNICWRLQPPKMEIIDDLEAITKEQLMYFFKKTNRKPEKIIFFRDGVSEGQFEQVKHAEIKAIRSACKKLQADGYEPAITFLVVQKRHHTRLFPLNPRDSEDKNQNVPAGTCVDTDITHPYMQDFYMVSHASIQGVAKPTKYCTLWDDNHLTNDQIEELTYHLCHLFSRCNRSVSYPAPTYYAHLAAARAKVYIENESLDMDNLNREFQRFQILSEIRHDRPMFFV